MLVWHYFKGLWYTPNGHTLKGQLVPTIRVPDTKNSHPYWPDELRAEGYVGPLKIHIGAFSLVIPHPNARNSQVAKDLRNLAEHLEFKAEIEEAAPQPKEKET